MLSEHQPLIVNVIGHMLGAILFGIFLVLALRGGAGQHPQNKLLSVASAFLAFFWNAGSFFSIADGPKIRLLPYTAHLRVSGGCATRR